MIRKLLVSALSQLSPKKYPIKNYHTGDHLKRVLKDKICCYVDNVKSFQNLYRNKKICDVRINEVYEGLNGIHALLNETSEIDQEYGVQFRGFSISQIFNLLPITCGNEFPSAEGLFWLFLTGEIPVHSQIASVSSEWAKRSCLPPHITELIKHLPKDLPPISKLSCCISALSIDNKILIPDVCKTRDCKKWEYVYEEVMDVIAKLPSIVAHLYQFTHFNNLSIPKADLKKDWASNLSMMMGFKDKEFEDFLRLFLLLQSDYGGGNVPTHAVHLTGSALSDAYLSLASGINGNTGLMVGLINNEIINFINGIASKVSTPASCDNVKSVCKSILERNQNIPLSCFAVQPRNDIRYEMLKKFGDEHFPTCPVFQVVKQLDKVMPSVLNDFGMNKCTWPSFDACSVAFFQHYNLSETFYAALFSMSRALGSLASYILHSALEKPLERPNSFSTNKYLELMESLPKNAGCYSECRPETPDEGGNCLSKFKFQPYIPDFYSRCRRTNTAQCHNPQLSS